ncbi:MAG: alpha-mannosidase [Thermoleophilia bacterium]|nr:alpha-mannosidase [Thermoleophilia bacterium]
MVGNAHIDPVWLWQWPEGYQEVWASFRSAIELMDEYPEFVFTSTSVCFLHWVEETDSELFEAIRARVADGRWQIVGGWWVEPDCNLPAGESLVRQALYGQRYLHDRFGIVSTTGANVDSFGHNASIPQLLRRSRMDSYIFLRPGPDELELPDRCFWWESPDGSRVLAYRIPYEYSSPGGDLATQIETQLGRVSAELPEVMLFYGVGNHGGGPTRANLDSIRRLNGADDSRALECSSPRAYFDRVAATDGDIPVVADELQHHAVGCYSAHSGVKRWNRRAENLLQRAEKWSVVADVAGGLAYPHAELTEAWKLVLFNQFHDTLCGTAIAPAYEDSRDQYGHACSLAANALNRAVQVISRQIDIPAEPGTSPVVVFNPHPWPLVADVEFELGLFRRGNVRMTDDEGAPVRVQRTRSYATVTGDRGRLVFPAEVPPLGYRVYRVHREDADPAPGIEATDTTLENEFLALEVDPATGWLSRLDDRVTGAELVPRYPAAHAVVVDDRSDTWGHGISAYDDAIGRFECTSVRLVEHGPVRSVLRVESRYGRSSLAEELVLGRDARYVEVRAVLDWRERHRLLKLRFPVALGAERATFEGPYGHVERTADGGEEPAQAWVDLSGTLRDGRPAGLSVINDSKYGHDAVAGNTRRSRIGMTAARSPVYAHHSPRQFEDGAVFDHLDQGRQEFRYRLLPHAGDWRAAGTVRLAAELNQPPFALLETYHPGPLPRRTSYAADGGGAVVLTVLKAAEDGSGDVVVRAYESTGRPARATFELPVLGRTLEAEFGPSEIKTFVVPRDPAAPAVETDLLEWSGDLPEQRPRVSEARPAEEARAPSEPAQAPHEGPARVVER